MKIINTNIQNISNFINKTTAIKIFLTSIILTSTYYGSQYATDSIKLNNELQMENNIVGKNISNNVEKIIKIDNQNKNEEINDFFQEERADFYRNKYGNDVGLEKLISINENEEFQQFLNIIKNNENINKIKVFFDNLDIDKSFIENLKNIEIKNKIIKIKENTEKTKTKISNFKIKNNSKINTKI